ncbi:hypothetical protein SMI01S_30700 [Sphingobacterium mizutaii NBRC 14946 = DSM 11724]|uniref:Four helix bundle sensory module for signal transduction n=2 Tax=Sphingobacterium mizutaii TaxID=1010 RepID=A0AAJ5BYV8_9SPHI|nr:hypothetical protein [Sphingobacterium mizutaii]GEM69464.1 hypothetical protein SMI01S_30700 [Sphingobacterium mizutaii NBRC 14946 = DSM 11724]SDL72222.1 hypothetical protein SAMN05192578_107113 [Sphingobacterium mizutaii]SNV41304.1 Uncharacterised protein [Sphingobacterium mizutaii]
MKKHSLFIIIALFFVQLLHAQDSTAVKADSLTFEAQRERVNHLLNERSRRFGEYDQSLEKKTGVFGLFKTKKDMQKSIDILRQVVLNDNNIFLETRKLLDLKDAQSERYQRLANEYDMQVSAYMKTITKLQNENDKLREELKSMESTDTGNGVLIYLAVIVIIALIILLIYQYNRHKPKKLTE